ncbi:LysE family translocator [Nitriliruptor alkaliphilus]|uniref:LysE family translocator n=1 Tax=Nitriliruptor alkaliphilus TaxID=427918 RepID=UPI00069607AB|nr:LysE family translocator [Nitriliruptor alkaliphilus]
MVSTSGVVGMALVALGIVLTPGPNMAYLVSRSVSQGRAAGLVSLLGVATGFGVYLLAAVAGVVAIFAAVPALYTALKLTGAAYLLYIAVRTFRPRTVDLSGADALPPDSHRRLFTMGLVTNLLNPKIAILYVSLLPQFVEPALGHVARQSLVLGTVQIAVAVTVNALIVLTAGALAARTAAHPAWERAQRWVSGTVLAGLAVRVAADRSRAVAVS